MSGRGRRLAKGAALVLAGAVGATAMTGIALAQDQAGGTPGEESGPSAIGRGLGRHLAIPGAGALLHGEHTVEMPDGTFTEVAVQNGTITAVGGTSVTVRSEDGFEAVYTITEDSEIRIDRDPAGAAELAVGRPARVAAEADGAVIRLFSATAEGEADFRERREDLRDRVADFLRQRTPAGETP